jgi:hypothetical protein
VRVQRRRTSLDRIEEATRPTTPLPATPLSSAPPFAAIKAATADLAIVGEANQGIANCSIAVPGAGKYRVEAIFDFEVTSGTTICVGALLIGGAEQGGNAILQGGLSTRVTCVQEWIVEVVEAKTFVLNARKSGGGGKAYAAHTKISVVQIV